MILRTLGKAMVVVGVVTLAAALVYPSVHQEALEYRAEDALVQYQQATSARTLPLPPSRLPAPASAPPSAPAMPDPSPTPGDVLGTVSIPALGMETVVVHGVGEEHLDAGTGHYPHTGLPGQGRTVGLAVHRGLVRDIDTQVSPGDLIEITSGDQTWTYSWEGYDVVAPSDVHVLDDRGDDRIVITTCHPWGSTAERLVGTAVLISTDQGET